jgi:hypothetical protein
MWRLPRLAASIRTSQESFNMAGLLNRLANLFPRRRHCVDKTGGVQLLK